jgi:N-formylglutamate amidohydrolase
VQIELNRALYMDEPAFEKTGGFSRLVSDLRLFVSELAQGLATCLGSDLPAGRPRHR